MALSLFQFATPIGRALTRINRIAVIAIALCGTGAFAQTSPAWTPIGPPGGTVLALTRSPASSDVLYAGTARNGVFMSADGGRSWARGNAGLPTSGTLPRRTVRALVRDGQYVYAATDAGLFYSAAGALATDLPDWKSLPATGSAAPISLLAVDVARGRLFAAATAVNAGSAPVVHALDLPLPGDAPAGAWVATPLPADTQDAGLGALAVVPSAGSDPALLLVGAADRVFAAPVTVTNATLAWTDADAQFNLRPTGLIESLHHAPDFSQTYACSGGQLFAASNLQDLAANTWLPIAIAPAPANALACGAMASGALATGAPAAVVLATSTGVYLSQDGSTFSATSALPVSAAANALLVVGGAQPTLFAGGGFGVSSQALATLAPAGAWSASNGPAIAASAQRLANAQVVDSAMIGTTLYAAVSDEQTTEVLASTDGGAGWSPTGLARVSGDGVVIRVLLADAGNRVLYAGTDSGLYALAGGNWVAVAPASISVANALARGGSAIYVGTDSGLFTIPLGASPAAATATAAGFDAKRVSALLVAGGKVYAGVFDFDAVLATAWVAADAAAPAWSEFATGPVGTKRINALALAGDALLAATRGEGLRIASPAGAWTDANNSSNAAEWLSDPKGVVLALYSDGITVFAATANNGLFSSPIGTPLRWTPANGSGLGALPSLEGGALRAEGTVLYASTGAGLWAFDGVGGSTPVTPPTPVDPGTGSSGGGGAMSGLALFGLALAAAVLRRGARRRDEADQNAYQGPLVASD